MFDKVFSDDSLIERLVRGENAAYEELVDGLVPELCAFFRFRKVGAEHVEDLAAAAIGRLYCFWSTSYDPRRGRPAAVVTTIARNVAADYWRDPNNSKLSALDDCAEPSCDPETTVTLEPEETAEQRLISLGISSLNAKDRSILEHRLRGATVIELAEILGILPNTAKARLRRAIQTLKSRVAELQQESTLNYDDPDGRQHASRQIRVRGLTRKPRVSLSGTKETCKHPAERITPNANSERRRKHDPGRMDPDSSK